MEKEIFKDIPGYEGLYQVSNLGNVMSLNYRSNGKMNLLSPSKSNKRYQTVCLCKNKKQTFYTIHVLVAIVFLGHKPCGMNLVVNHIDHDKSNNKVENLEIVTQRKNCSWRKFHGSSKHVGVYFNTLRGKYCSVIEIKGKSVYLGSFENEDDAGRAYQKALSNLPI